jgi:hypothetical protein
VAWSSQIKQSSAGSWIHIFGRLSLVAHSLVNYLVETSLFLIWSEVGINNMESLLVYCGIWMLLQLFQVIYNACFLHDVNEFILIALVDEVGLTDFQNIFDSLQSYS